MRWYLTQKVVGEPEIDVRDEDEDLTLDYSIMRELARRDATLVEIAPGVWRQSKTDESREAEGPASHVEATIKSKPPREA